MGTDQSPSGGAIARWREQLAGWAIPPEILRAAPEPPWGFSVAHFSARADAALGAGTPSAPHALAALPEGGSVLDVGCGAGAASLPLLGRAGSVTGVDSSPEMLSAFVAKVSRPGVTAAALNGQWPADAAEAGVADVVVCHHVAYNVPDLAGLATALTGHARHRVVLELTDRHPMTELRGAWRALWDLDRPSGPTADDAVAVLHETGIAAAREDWEAPGFGGFVDPDDAVRFVRRRLCLPADRDPEIAAVVRDELTENGGRWYFGVRRHTTLWWPGNPD